MEPKAAANHRAEPEDAIGKARPDDSGRYASQKVPAGNATGVTLTVFQPTTGVKTALEASRLLGLPPESL